MNIFTRCWRTWPASQNLYPRRYHRCGRNSWWCTCGAVIHGEPQKRTGGEEVTFIYFKIFVGIRCFHSKNFVFRSSFLWKLKQVFIRDNSKYTYEDKANTRVKAKKNLIPTTIITNLDKYIKKINQILSRLSSKADNFFEKNKIPLNKRSIVVSLDLRYLRQNYELNVKCDKLQILKSDLVKIQRNFNKIHEKNYGHYFQDGIIQIVNINYFPPSTSNGKTSVPFSSRKRPDSFLKVPHISFCCFTIWIYWVNTPIIRIQIIKSSF